MIDLYTAGTANGHRASVALEECGLPYRVHAIDLAKGENKAPDFLKINPQGAIPAIVDGDGPGGKPLALAQSGAIILYLAEKTRKFLPADAAARAVAYQWFVQACSDIAGVNSAIFALANRVPEKTPSTIKFFEDRLLNYLGNFDRRLAAAEFLAGAISIADLALVPVANQRRDMIRGAGLKNLTRWYEAMAARPGVARGLKVPG